MSTRSHALADRLELGVKSLIDLAEGLSDAEWRRSIGKDRRTVGVVIHHVASVFPVEIDLALALANGRAIEGVTWNDIHAMNAKHAEEHKSVTKAETLELLRKNASLAAIAIRALADVHLDAAASNSLYGGAVLTCQFMLEDHAVRHSVHHLDKIRQALLATAGV